jgi:hypothetical protein
MGMQGADLSEQSAAGAGVLALNAALAPSAANPVLTAESALMPAKLDSVVTVVAASANAEILPAPAAGYVNVIVNVLVCNQSASQTAGYRVTCGGSEMYESALTTTIAASGNTSLFGQLADGALQGYATGLGDVSFAVTYFAIPTGVRFGLQKVVLTGVYQTLSAPAAGYVRYRAILAVPSATGIGATALMNADSAAAVAMAEFTRGSDVTVITASSLAAHTRTTAALALPAHRSTDVVKVKCASAPTANKVCFWYSYMDLPVQT